MTRPRLGDERTNWRVAAAGISNAIGLLSIIVGIAAGASGMPNGALTLAVLACVFIAAGFVLERI